MADNFCNVQSIIFYNNKVIIQVKLYLIIIVQCMEH